MKPIGENAVRTVQNVIIALLFVSTLVLAGTCFVLMSRTGETDNDGLPFKLSDIGESESEYLEYKTTMLSPAFVTVKDGGKEYITYDSTAEKAYKLAVKDALSVLSLGKLEADTWTDGENEIFIRFRSALPLVALLDYAGGDTATVSPSVSVTEMKISYGVSSAKMTVRSGESVYSVTAYLPVTEYGAVISAVLSPNALMATLKDGVTLPDGNLQINRYTASVGIDADSLTRSEREDLIGIFAMNPDKVKTNVHQSGGITFVDVSGTVVVDSSVKYTAYESGTKINLSAYGSGDTVSTYMLAADSYVAKVAASVGCDKLPSLCFNGVTVDGDVMTLDYVFVADNVMLTKDGEALGASVSFRDDRIVSLEIDAVTLTKTNEVCSLLSAGIAYEAHSAGGRVRALLPAIDVDGETTAAKWCAIYGGDGE